MTIKGFPEDSPARYKPAAPRFGTGTRRGPRPRPHRAGDPGGGFRSAIRAAPRPDRCGRTAAARPPSGAAARRFPAARRGPAPEKPARRPGPAPAPSPEGPARGKGPGPTARSAAGPGAAPGAGPRRAGRAGRGGPTAGSPCARRVIGGGSGAAYRRPWSLPSGPRPAPLPAEENTCPERGRGRAQRWVAPFRARRRTLPQAGAARRRGLAAARGRAARTGNPAVRLRGPGRPEASGLGLLARLRCVPQLRFSRGRSAPAAMSAGATAGALGPAPASRSRLRPARGRATRSALRAIRLCWVVSRHRGPQGGAECVRARRVFRSAWPLCRVRAWPDDELQDWWETLRVKLLVCRSNCAKWVICLPAPLRSAT